MRFIDPDGNTVTDPKGNIVFTVTQANTRQLQLEIDRGAGVIQRVYYQGDAGKILTDKGNEVEAFRANVNIAFVETLQSDGKGGYVSLGTEEVSANRDCSHNCAGNAFGNQALNIDNAEIDEQFIQDEGYRDLKPGDTPQKGDVGVFKNKDGDAVHFERYESSNSVNSKGGSRADKSSIAPNTNPTFANGKNTYSVMTKTQPNKVVNTNSGNASGGLRTVSKEEFEKIQKQVQNR